MRAEELIDLAEEKMLVAAEARHKRDYDYLMGMAAAYLDVYERVKRDEEWRKEE